MTEKREQLKLHHLRPAEGSKKKAQRVGRGERGRRGKTAGRGTKGLKARGTVINVDRLEAFRAGSTVTVEDLRAKGLVKKRGKVKVLGQGDLTKSLTVHAHGFSTSARDKIEGAGGSCTVVE